MTQISDSPSIEKRVELVNSRGLHARASAKFVKTAENFNATISVEKDGISVCGTSIMGLMLLAAARGDHVLLRASGDQAHEALEALSELIADRFQEAD
ncbi:HPr kinase [Iodidimonas gelatinilytica]|uniref:HPr kinase n=1 Tax=Iodidimonas gelatinilytica TaxID=1236966 RepID=A0A5A7MYK0_9PROT|nr:HPr family phosphocarrier protein [Iodidimonas gelatinilytica]GEQ97688.1 HPr kinase [Iodidimonas gelatinilytica]GER00957.1 HPr kinase [Iodidimonas gelatinilytica]